MGCQKSTIEGGLVFPGFVPPVRRSRPIRGGLGSFVGGSTLHRAKSPAEITSALSRLGIGVATLARAWEFRRLATAATPKSEIDAALRLTVTVKPVCVRATFPSRQPQVFNGPLSSTMPSGWGQCGHPG